MKVQKVCMVIVLSLLISLFAGVGVIEAADKVIIVDVQGLTKGAYSLEYEWKVSPNTSGAVQGLFWEQKTKENGEDIKFQALAAAVGMRKYLGDETFKGVYIGVYGAGASIDVTSPQKAKAFSFGASGVIGVKWISEGGIALDFGFSAGVPIFTNISAPELSLSEKVTFGATGTAITLGIGYAW